jgi:uridylate kinase
MPKPDKVVFLKQSGETLSSGEAGGLWKPEGVRTAADKIARAHKMREASDVTNLVVVSGAGNIVRGKLLKEHRIAGSYADAIGRMATIQNTLVLSQALEELGVGTSVLLSPNMVYSDPSVLHVRSYTPECVVEAEMQHKVTLIAGGTGEDNVTTDHAVVFYAADYHRAHPTREVLVLKGTKFDGVYEGDPAKNANAARFSLIGAPEMLEYPNLYEVVDEASLLALVDNRLDMRVYNDGIHDLVTVMEMERSASNGSSIGTLIMHESVQKVLAS